ncbi:MAG: efflux RND transporter periplasmic adaptor subunit [Eubacterium sp.]|nr:efflux RND transporter periplasmic adaptor subunit [Eubacterium sp.]
MKKTVIKIKCNKKHKIMKRVVPFGLAFCFMLTGSGCGDKKKKTEEIPELIESTVTNEALRPVTRGDIGSMTVIMTRAVPKNYSQYFDVDRTIEKMYVKYGDYVEKGDKLAEASTKEIDDSIDNYEKTRKNLQDSIDADWAGYYRSIESMEYDRDSYIQVGDSEGASKMDNEINLFKENFNYSQEQKKQQLDNIDKELSRLSEEKEKLTIYASHSGYVTYAANLDYYSYIRAYENVVMISDYDDIYLEADTMNIKAFSKYRTAEKMYALIEGKTYPASEYTYAPSVSLYAQSVGKYPCVRFKLEGYDISLGETVPICIYPEYIENVLLVGNDSIRNDGSKRYVFVQGPTGGMEKREIEVGTTDGINTEVITGLEEGENVYYLSSDLTPINYEQITVTRDDYKMYITSDTYRHISTDIDSYACPEDGKYYKNEAVDGADVKEGDPLYTIRVELYSEAKILEATQNIKYAKRQHEDTLEALYGNLDRIDEEIKKAQNAEAPAATDTDAIRENMHKLDKLQIEREQAVNDIQNENDSYDKNISEMEKEYNKMRSINDNDGLVTIYAKRAGKLKYTGYCYPDNQVYRGQQVASVECGEADKILVKSTGKNMANLPGPAPGVKVQLTGKEKTYEGVITGLLGDGYEASKIYVDEKDGKAVFTTNPENTFSGIETGYFINVDKDFTGEEEHVHISYETVSLKRAIVIPTKCICSEKNVTGSTTKYFVWKLENGELTKKYIDYFTNYNSGDNSLIFGGIEEGDIIALDKNGGGK